MKLNQLRYYEVICKYSNLTRAAEELHVSQSSLSGVIGDLEREFGVTLFQRLRNGLQLTSEGEKLRALAVPLLRQADELCNQMTELGQKNHLVKIGVPPMIGSSIFPDLFRMMREKFPNTTLEMAETGSLSGPSLLTDGKLDAAIISGNQQLPGMLECAEIKKTRILFYISIDTPLAGMEKLDFARIGNQPLVLLQENSFISYFVQKEFENAGTEPETTLHTSKLYTIRKLLARDSAATFLYEDILDPEEEDIIGIPLPDDPEIPIRLVWRKDHQQSVGLRNLIHIVESRTQHRS